MKTRKPAKAALVAVVVLSLLALVGSSMAAAQGGDPGQIVAMNVNSSSITWTPLAGNYAGLLLTITGPNGFYYRKDFGGRATISSRGLEDGSYTYEVVLTIGAALPDFASDQKDRGLGFAPSQNRTQSGGFMVLGGSFAAGGTESAADIVNPDDVIVQGSLCVGFDCVNNENFGFDTVRLKENNVRIQFDDTSSVAGYSTNNWQLRANSGASSFLGFVDQGAAGNSEDGTVIFAVAAGAPANSLYVSSAGRIGLRTATPVLELHIVDSDTPSIRLEQNSSGGYSPQTWDIAGNEANFFIRDVTSGSRLPFRIRPGAPTSSIDVNADGDVGIGTASPVYDLHVVRSAVNAKIAATRVDSGVDGAVIKLQSNTNRGFVGTENNFHLGFMVNNIEKMLLTTSGNLTVEGSVTATAFNSPSDRHIKENFVDVNRASVLERLSRIPISTWNFIGGDGARHMGPMAQDFYAAFGLGTDDKHISTVDADGVAFAAIQELDLRNQALASENASLRGQVNDLAARVSSLEAGGVPSASLLTWLLVASNLALIVWTVFSARRVNALRSAAIEK